MKKIMVLLILVSFLTGCGYTTQSLLPSKFKTIHIAIFENRTYEYQIETNLANEIANEFILDGRLQVVNVGKADTQLTGTIVEYRRDPLVYNKNDDVTQYQIQVFADVVLKDMNDGSIVWEGNRIKGEDIYFLTGSLANTEEDAKWGAFKDLAKNIVAQVIEGW